MNPHLAGIIAPTSVVMNIGGRSASYGGAAYCVCGTSQPLVFLMFCWTQCGCAERFHLNILCDLLFKPTPSEEDLTVTRS